MTKTYQVFDVPRFPELTRIGERFTTKHQRTIWGENEQIKTRLTLLGKSSAHGYQELKIKTEIVVRAFGFIKVFDDSTRELKKLDFTEYMRPVDFACFYFPDESFGVLQASKHICKGVLRNLQGKTDEIVFEELQLDFSKLPQSVHRLTGAWFRDVSANIRSEGFTGDDIEHDERVRMLMDRAASATLNTSLSTITIPYELHNANHQIQITKEGAVCLQHQYQSTETELELVMGVKRDILDQIRM